MAYDLIQQRMDQEKKNRTENQWQRGTGCTQKICKSCSDTMKKLIKHINGAEGSQRNLEARRKKEGKESVVCIIPNARGNKAEYIQS